MDMSINKIHHMLLDAALPSTIEDLKNPTEDYIVNLLKAFLSRFNFDVNIINQPIPEQYNVMMCYEDSDIFINLINLYAVVTQIFTNIFLHDFCFTDMTNPGQKRLKKHAKFLSNFVLYTMHKMPEFNDKRDQIEATSRLLEELKEKNAQVMELINNKAKHKSNQSSMINKLESDIQHMLLQTEKHNKKELQLEGVKNEVEKENQIAKEQYGSVKTAMGKLSKEIAELQSEVVNSPEKYQSRLNELIRQNKLKEEERDILKEAIQERKQSIKQIGEELNFVFKMNDKFSTLVDVDTKELINKKTKLNNSRKQIDSLNIILNDWQNKLAMHKNQKNTDQKKQQLHHEEEIIPLSNLRNQLLSEKKEQKAKFDANQVYFNEKCLKKNKLQVDIKKKEEQITVFIHNCKEIYDNELAKALIGLFQLVILLMLSGILFSLAAVSRLMEITIILIYPTAVFLLRQSANLIILLTILVTRMTSSAFQKLCELVKCNQYLVDQSRERIPQREEIPSPLPQVPEGTLSLLLDTETPFVPYKKTILEEIPAELLSLKDEFSTVSLNQDKGIIEPPQDQSQDNNSTKELTANNEVTDC